MRKYRTATDSERLRQYDKLVRTLLLNCPLGDKPSSVKVRRWARAYNALFAVAAIKTVVL